MNVLQLVVYGDISVADMSLSYNKYPWAGHEKHMGEGGVDTALHPNHFTPEKESRATIKGEMICETNLMQQM